MKEKDVRQRALDIEDWTSSPGFIRKAPRWLETGPIEGLALETWESSPKWHDEPSLELYRYASNLTVVSPESSLALSDVVFDIIKMLSDPDQEMCPTEHAFLSAIQMVMGAGQSMGLTFPRGYVYGDAEKGIRIAWHNKGREVTFQVPDNPARRQYIYFEDAAERGIKEPVTSEILEERLRWLAQGG